MATLGEFQDRVGFGGSGAGKCYLGLELDVFDTADESLFAVGGLALADAWLACDPDAGGAGFIVDYSTQLRFILSPGSASALWRALAVSSGRPLSTSGLLLQCPPGDSRV